MPSGTEPTRFAAPARACAYAVVRRVFEQDAWADRALHGEARRLRLDTRERALATQLAFGTVQRAATLDHVIERLAERPPNGSTRRCSPRCGSGVFQLAFLDRVPPHAAVGESVELAKADAPRGAGLVNAVLRRAAREARAADRGAARRDARARRRSSTRTPTGSPQLWFDALGPEDARALMAADNRARRGGPARQHAAHDRRASSPSGCPAHVATATR